MDSFSCIEFQCQLDLEVTLTHAALELWSSRGESVIMQSSTARFSAVHQMEDAILPHDALIDADHVTRIKNVHRVRQLLEFAGSAASVGKAIPFSHSESYAALSTRASLPQEFIHCPKRGRKK